MKVYACHGLKLSKELEAYSQFDSAFIVLVQFDIRQLSIGYVAFKTYILATEKTKYGCS